MVSIIYNWNPDDILSLDVNVYIYTISTDLKGRRFQIHSEDRIRGQWIYNHPTDGTFQVKWFYEGFASCVEKKILHSENKLSPNIWQNSYHNVSNEARIKAVVFWCIAKQHLSCDSIHCKTIWRQWTIRDIKTCLIYFYFVRFFLYIQTHLYMNEWERLNEWERFNQVWGFRTWIIDILTYEP